MAQQDFGIRLAEARKKRGLTLDQVHSRLRITPAILESLEHADFHHMPLKGHARNMVSAYARFLGLDSNEITKQFLREYRDFENHLARSSGNHVYHSSNGNSGGVENRSSSAVGSYSQAGSQGLNSMWNKPLPKSQLNYEQEGGSALQQQVGHEKEPQARAGVDLGGGFVGGYAGRQQVPGASSGYGKRQPAGGVSPSGYGQRSRVAGASGVAGSGYSQRQSVGGTVGAASAYGKRWNVDEANYGRAVPTGSSTFNSGSKVGGYNYDARSSRHQYSSHSYQQSNTGRKRVQGDEGTRPKKAIFGSRKRSASDGGRLDNAIGMGSYPAKPSLPLRLFGSLLNSPIALVITLILVLVLLFAVWAVVANSCKAANEEDLTPKPVGSVVSGDTTDTGEGIDALLGGEQQNANPELVVTPAAGSAPYTSVEVDGAEVFANSAFEAEQKWTLTQNCEVITSQPNNLTVTIGGEVVTPEIGDDGFAYYIYTVPTPTDITGGGATGAAS